jgi:hypothetical protein
LASGRARHRVRSRSLNDHAPRPGGSRSRVALASGGRARRHRVVWGARDRRPRISSDVPARARGRAQVVVTSAELVRPCFGFSPKLDHAELAFCARVDGRVVYSQLESGETHVLVIGDFHIVLVELPAGIRRPGWGLRIAAVGPLLRARNGQRELQAIRVDES